jgi:hypothetical protein
MDVMPARPSADKTDQKAPAPNDKPDEKKPAEAAPAVPPKPKAPKQPNIGLAITATVIIVLGLAALATYAYLKSR